MPSRFPPPWWIEDTGHAFAVKDATGFALTWFHYATHDVVGTNPDRMTKRQAWAFAVNFIKLPALLVKDRAPPA